VPADIRDLFTAEVDVYRPGHGRNDGGESTLGPWTALASGVCCEIQRRTGRVRERGYGREPEGDYLGIFLPGDIELQEEDLVVATGGPFEGKKFWVRSVRPFEDWSVEVDLDLTHELGLPPF